MDGTERFFVDCVKAGIKGQTITEIPATIDYKKLYKLCAVNSVSVIVFCALQSVKDSLPIKFYDFLKTAVRRYVIKDTQLNADCETVINAFEKGGVKFMPLKGYELKNLYPKTEMRYTSDCDILIDGKEIRKVRRIIAGLGVKVERHDEHHDIVYFDKTKSVFELHKTLFVGKLKDYFKVGFEKAKLKDGYKYYYELSPEDFYMTLIAHSAYHFAEAGGVGIRHIADIYVFKKYNELDKEYLLREFDKCGLKMFAEQFEKLEQFFFEDKNADNFTLKLADYVLSSGVLGNSDKKEAAEVAANKTKTMATFKMIFPPASNMKFSYPILNKAIFLLPVFYVVRWFRIIFLTPKRLLRMKKVNSAKPEDVKQIKELRAGLGIGSLK